MTAAECLIQIASVMKARDALRLVSTEYRSVLDGSVSRPARSCKLCPSWHYADDAEFHRPECVFTTLQQHIDWLSHQPAKAEG